MKTSISILFISIFFSCYRLKNTETVKNVFIKDTFNFGQIDIRDTFTSLVYYRNFSEKEIKIVRIENACGCTNAFLKDSVVKIKDSLPITFTYIPFKNKDSGDITKFITIRTDSEIPFSNIVIKGNVK